MNYFRAGHVVRAVLRGDMYTAQVQGSEFEPYRVTVTLRPEGALAGATGTGPYDWGGDCKHIVWVCAPAAGKSGSWMVSARAWL